MYFYDSNKGVFIPLPSRIDADRSGFLIAVGGCEYPDKEDPGNLQFDWLEVQLDGFRERNMQVRDAPRGYDRRALTDGGGGLTGLRHRPRSPVSRQLLPGMRTSCVVRVSDMAADGGSGDAVRPLRGARAALSGHHPRPPLRGRHDRSPASAAPHALTRAVCPQHMNADHFFFLEADDLELPASPRAARRVGAASHDALYAALISDFEDLPRRAKIDAGDYAVVNVAPAVVPNPYTPGFRVFSYNITGAEGRVAGGGGSRGKEGGFGGERITPDDEASEADDGREEHVEATGKRKHGHHRGGKGDKQSGCKKGPWADTWRCQWVSFYGALMK